MMKNLLIVNQDAHFIKQLSNKLSNVFLEILSTDNFSAAEIILQENEIDFLILPFKLEDDSAIFFTESIKLQSRYIRTQIVIIDEKYSRTNEINSLKSGAIYYFSKENIFSELPEAIINISNLTNLIYQGGETILLYEPDTLRQNIIKSLLYMANITVNSFNSIKKTSTFIKSNIVDIDIFIIYCNEIDDISELITLIRQHENYSHSPIIIISDNVDPVKIYKLFLFGITDFMKNPLDVCDFFIKLRTHLKLNYIMKILETKNKLLAIKATTDELTGLFNRRFFWEMLKKEISRSKRQNTVFSILMLDIDDFKHINDTYGHLAGDTVLKTLANIFKKQLRQSDTVARFGGEEFIILLPDTDADKAFIVGNKLRKIIEKTNFTNIDEKITVSIGISDSTEAEDFETIVYLSDERLYKAKKAGKNKVVKK
jgi:two-component system cell cycle response regulator